jgi:hypothetical protein
MNFEENCKWLYYTVKIQGRDRQKRYQFKMSKERRTRTLEHNNRSEDEQLIVRRHKTITKQ